MAKSIEPVQFLQFGGVQTSGHPLRRPPNSAALCNNLRVMPGGSLRLRGGTIIRYDSGSGQYLQFHQFQRADGTGNIECIAQWSGASRKWQRFTVSSPTFTPADLETIDITHGITGNLQAITNVRNRVYFYNGKGTNSASVSTPALSSWDGTQLRYVGLETHGSPTVAIVLGAGFNTIVSQRTFYVGLYNSATGHMSNGVLAGTVSTVGTGTITVSALNTLTKVSHNAGELAELFFVFYSTLDGGQTPYLIMDSTGLVPLTQAVSSSTKSLSVTASQTAGFIIDPTQEMPTQNYPPRPMAHIVFANGRVYGITEPGGVGTPYVFTARESPRAVFSAAADQIQGNDFVGLPEESWPLTNAKYTPTGDPPLYCAKGPNETNVLYLTKKTSLLLEETADGLHEWVTISATEGIGKPESYAQTPYGSMWITQRAQLVLLRPGAPQLQVLSGAFQALIPNGTVGVPIYPTCADYVSSPSHEIDRYQCWLSDGTSIVYDFAVGGQAYKFLAQDFTAAKTLDDANGLRYHVVGKRYIWTHEVDPFTDQVPAMDETATSVWAEIDGTYIGQWMDFGDSSVRKEFTDLDVIGDGGAVTLPTPAVSALVFKVYSDLTSAADTPTVFKIDQSTTDHAYRGKITNTPKMWMKFYVKLIGHSADWYGGVAQQRFYPIPTTDGDLAPSISGQVWQVRVTMNPTGGNRP